MGRFSEIKRVLTDTMEAESAVTLYDLLKQGTLDNQCAPSSVQGAKGVGVALNAAAAGEAVEVMKIGRVPVIISSAASVALGVSLTSSASAGQAGIATTGDYVFGTAVDAASSDGDQICADVDFMKYETPVA